MAGKRDWRAGAMRLGAGAAGLAMAVILLVAQSRMPSKAAPSPSARLQMLYAANPPDKNPFATFDKQFKQATFRKQPTEANVFLNFDKGFQQPKYRSLAEQETQDKNDENPFESTPSNYPFDETQGGHVWKHWEGDTPTATLKEFNALDTGTPDAAFKLGEHTLGRPFHEFKPDKNVFDALSPDDENGEPETYKWGATDKSIPDSNVWAGLSPDSGYADEK